VKDVVDAIRGALAAGEAVAVASIFVQEGSAPRSAGTKMVVRRDGSFAGTVGGGVLEARVLGTVPEVLRSGGAVLLAFDLTKSDVATMDMICGGRLRVLVERVDPTDDDRRVFDRLADRLDQGRGAVLVTAIGAEGEGPWPTDRCLLGDGEAVGGLSLGAGVAAEVARATEGAKAPSLIAAGGRRLFVELVPAVATVYFFGGGHVTGETEALARRVGFRTRVFDDRPEFATRERFPEALDVRVVPGFEGVFEGCPPDRNSYVVIITRGHSFDRVVLEQALATQAGYVGMIGSQHKKRAIYAALREQGVRQEDLDRVHCPVGIEIEAETPAEIAVSIVGELIRERAGAGQ